MSGAVSGSAAAACAASGRCEATAAKILGTLDPEAEEDERRREEAEGGDDGRPVKCEAREIRAERLGADNSLWTWGCTSDVGETSSLMTGFNSRTGMPQWTHRTEFPSEDAATADQVHERTSGTAHKGIFGDTNTIRPPPTPDHPTKVDGPLFDPRRAPADGGLYGMGKRT